MAPSRSLVGQHGAEQDRVVGRLLGARYRVLSRLGEGGMGTVYLCEHAVLGRRYAVKVLRPDLGSDPELAERFRNEAIAASRVHGDNVVDVLDFGTSDEGALYYVMEALEGRSLGAIIASEGPLEVSRAIALLEQICRALAVAHARGVVHRDVKPDNIFVVWREDGSERAKVIDFGISKVTLDGSSGERLTRAGTIIGTPEYMAPEQAAGDPVDHRADIYALGVVAYEMLTASLPIVATTPIATLVAHQTYRPDAPSRRRPGIPRELDAVVLSALEKRPEKRPPSMEAFAAALAAIRSGRAPPALASAAPARSDSSPGAPTLPLDATPRPLFRRRAVRAAALAGAVALVGAGAALWARASRRAPSPVAAVAPAGAAAVAPAAPAARPAPAVAPEPAPPPAPARKASPRTTDAPPAAPAAPTARERTPRSRRSSRDAHLDDPYGSGALKPDPF